MSKMILVAALSCGCMGAATSVFAQQNENPMGLDYGPFHPPVPPQVTTYYPPPPAAVPMRRHHRLHRMPY